MKKKIGKLWGKPVVIGGEHEVTKNEFHFSKENGIRVRKSDGSLEPIVPPPPTPPSPSTVNTVE